MLTGETFEQALLREVLKGTGLQIVVQGLSGFYKNVEAGVVALVFRAQRTGGELRINDEVVAFEWLSPSEIEKRVEPVFAVRLKDAEKDTVSATSHDGRRVLNDIGRRSTG